jgi:predicted DNA-binding transcriptional regulator AlpA
VSFSICLSNSWHKQNRYFASALSSIFPIHKWINMPRTPSSNAKFQPLLHPQHNAQVFDGSYYIDAKELTCMLKISRQTVERYIAAGQFPNKVYVSQRRVRWIRNEIEQWMNQISTNRQTHQDAATNLGPHNIFQRSK